MPLQHARGILPAAIPALILLASLPSCRAPVDRADSVSPSSAEPNARVGNPPISPYSTPASAPPRGDDSSATNGPATPFRDVTLAAGIDHVHHKPVLDRKLDNIMAWVASVGAAAAAADYDRDGWIDLFVTDSAKGRPNHLYRNNGDRTFTDVAVKAGLANLNNDRGTAMDAIWGDYDNDGWPDLYIVRWGEDLLLRNNTDGTFTDVTARLFKRRDGSPGMQWANGCGAIWLDYNLDGRLDVYVGNYFKETDLWHLADTHIMHDDFENSRNAGRNFLFRQNPDGSFTDVAESLEVDDCGWTLAVGSGDVNNDGLPDLYVANDFGPDKLYLNAGRGRFVNVSDSAIGHDTRKGMNVDFGDIDNDGWLDIFVTNITTSEYLQEGNMLWHNHGVDPDTGETTFTDLSLEVGVYDGGWGWGGKFFDADNDGDLDLYAVNGFISAGEGSYWYDLASWTVLGEDSADAANWPAIGDRSFSGYEKNRFWRNDGSLSFTQRADEVGLGIDHDGRGIVCFDYDNDGDLDLYIANQNQPGNLFENTLADRGHWLVVHLEADPAAGCNRDAVGARVTVATPNGKQIRERDGGNGYSGQSDPRLHFGLGREMTVQLLEIRWPDGGIQYFEDVPADSRLRIKQNPDAYAMQITSKPRVPTPDAIATTTSAAEPAVALSASELEAQLTRLETELNARPGSYTIASRYRTICADLNQHDRAVEFLKSLADAHPAQPATRVGLACAYVDKIVTCGGLAAIVSKGTLARKSLDQLDVLARSNPDRWEVFYCRGQNHLHWPRALRHSEDAITDFRHCLELQRKSTNEADFPHFERTYVALGDAHTKNKDYAAARAVWRDGLERFPTSAELKRRLDMTDDAALLKFVEDERSLERRIDTDLSFLESPTTNGR